MNHAETLAKLTVDMPAHWQRVEGRVIEAIAAGYAPWLAALEIRASSDSDDYLLCRYLIEHGQTQFENINQLRRWQGEFNRRYALASSVDERRSLILGAAAQLGATPRQLRLDARAFRRWLGADAIGDRFRHRLAEAELNLAATLRRLGAVAAICLETAQHEQLPALWARLGLEAGVRESLLHDGSMHVREAAFACLSKALRALPKAYQEAMISKTLVQFIYRSALESRQGTWVQCEALFLLRTISPENFVLLARNRLAKPQPDSDLFVRRRIVTLMADMLTEHPLLLAEVARAATDPSAYVRQEVATTLLQAPPADIVALFPRLLHADPVPQVRAAAALQLPTLFLQPGLPAEAWLLQALDTETDPFACRVLMHTAVACIATLKTENHSLAVALGEKLDAIHLGATDLRLRRWAAQYKEHIWLLSDPQAVRLSALLSPALKACQPGGKVLLPRQLDDVPAALLGRILAVLVQQDYGVELERTRKGWHLWRGHRFQFRLWRWLHEMRHPSPDKRQAFRHTIGRGFRGNLHAPSGILAELAETKVPGEPLQISAEAGWRPYLPLVDELISALDEPFRAPPLLLATAEGMTRVQVPSSLIGRLRARLALTRRFAHYAHLRNWSEDSQNDPSHYLQALAAIGIRVEFLAHGPSPSSSNRIDPAVARFFPIPVVIGVSGFDLWQRFENYFFSVFENSLFELMLFTTVGLGLFVARHLYQNHLIHRARAALPLVIGGWGTRGKSGTERIKAALFNALGYSIVSKTTGCEAMFLHGQVFDQLREMFLFRPYDKATIWEQHNLVRLAEKLGCQIFLWECMALTPSFVQLLQRRWMRDDISTITNTFPDHEDLQGPAGINIAQVMTNFIPDKGCLLTSEEQMRPILQTAADALQTRLRGVGWLESGLLAPDVLARFPYQEHPDNIALVLALADELGIAADFALKEMADRVVADLGVLKTYPVALVEGRRLSFINGMSANERFGCLGNWSRLGFERITPESDPGVLICTVVNNRADRVARSRVFAGILVEDISADYHFLIGSNLAGLQGYIQEAWQVHAEEISLWPVTQAEAPLEVFTTFARRLRIPHRPQHIEARLHAMLQGQGITDSAAALACWQDPEGLEKALQQSGCTQIEAILASIEQSATMLSEYNSFAARITQESGNSAKPPKLDEDFRNLLWLWFKRKLVVVEDFHATGNQIIGLIAQHTPPGIENRIMGIQNIKGTGLDFVYRWQAWDSCYRACQEMQSNDAATVDRGLADLTAFQEYGVLCDAHVRQTLAKVRPSKLFQQERQQAQLAVIEANLDAAMLQVRQSMQARRAAGKIERLLGAIEGFFDAGDAVKRRVKADRIYADLVDERISHARAAIELQSLNKRQKGGWLYADLREKITRLLALFPGRYN